MFNNSDVLSLIQEVMEENTLSLTRREGQNTLFFYDKWTTSPQEAFGWLEPAFNNKGCVLGKRPISNSHDVLQGDQIVGCLTIISMSVNVELQITFTPPNQDSPPLSAARSRLSSS